MIDYFINNLINMFCFNLFFYFHSNIDISKWQAHKNNKKINLSHKYNTQINLLKSLKISQNIY